MIEPAMILVRPQMGENIGAAARAMLNFGLTRMRVVAPRDGWPSPKAVAMASGSGRVLDQAGLFADLPAAVADCDYVLATTARDRDLTKPVLSPEEAMSRVRAMAMLPRSFFRPLLASFLIGALVAFWLMSAFMPPPWIMKSLMTRWKIVPS